MDDEDDALSSDLGTKDYWKEFYETELNNFKEYGDIGEIWFGKENVKRVVKWLDLHNVSKSSSVLDVGCGNGALLFHLAEAGYQNLTGIDYVDEAIELAANVAKEKECCDVQLEAADFLCDLTSVPESSCLKKTYKVIIDKGTYDAVGLCPQDGKGKREKYRENVLQLLDADGYFIIVSCNWTLEELTSHFKGDIRNSVECIG